MISAQASISSAAMADHTDADVQRLTDALNKVGVRLECPSCGHPEWAALGTTVVLPASGVQPGFEAEGAACLALACKRCGFVRASQGADETVNDYLSRLLKMAEGCKYDQFRDEAVRDQLVNGTSITAARGG